METRARSLSLHPKTGTCVVYWMSRDQRVHDNWALLLAQKEAEKLHLPLVVVFFLSRTFLQATPAHYAFMISGLQEVEKTLSSYRIPFFLIQGDSIHELITFLGRLQPAVIVSDFDPLAIKRTWKSLVIESLPATCLEVDTHNIVPCWIASDHQEFSARTFRPKIHKALSFFLTDIPSPHIHPYPWKTFSPSHTWPPLVSLPPAYPRPGEEAARHALMDFLSHGIHRYATEKNHPLKQATSRLSAYLHFGQLSAQRVAYEITQSPSIAFENTKVFLEELIVRRELSDNFVWYQKHYDSWEGLPAWAQKSLDRHRHDPRPFLYDLETLDQGKTHDPLWNACQKTMRLTGYLHGYLRMYWAKKILEWTPSPEKAIEWAILLNNTYFLDGRDPNGYAGVLWSIGGLHDRPFGDKPIIGQIRPMTLSGCARKFSVTDYIHWAQSL